MYVVPSTVKTAMGAGLALVMAFAIGLPAQAETLKEKIQAAGVVTVATEAATPPFEFVKDGQIVGYGKDVLDAIVADLGVKLNQLNLPWQGILPGLLAGKFDFVATSVSILPDRVTKYAFTMPLAYDQDVILKRKGDASITSENDLRGKVVGTQLSSSSEDNTNKLNDRLKANGGQGLGDIKLFTSYPDTWLALSNGSIDAIVSGIGIVNQLMQQRPDEFEIVAPVADKIYVAWVTRPEDADFRDYLNTVIKQLNDSGKLAEFQQKWFGYKMDIPTSGYLPAGAL